MSLPRLAIRGGWRLLSHPLTARFEPAPELAILEPSPTEGLVRNRSELVDSPFVNVVENAFDESHVHFLHQRTLGIATPLVPRQIVKRDDDGRGVSVRWDMESSWGHELFESYDYPRGRLAAWIQKRTGKQLHGERRWGFRLGGLVSFHEHYDTGKAVRVIGAITPMDEEHTWLTTALSHPVAKSVPQWLMKLWGRTLNAEDRTGTTGLLRDANALARPVSVLADQGPLLFRRILEQAKRGERAPLSRFAHAEANGNRDAPEHVRKLPGALDRPDGGAIQGTAPR
jgi:hypothetical protein